LQSASRRTEKSTEQNNRQQTPDSAYNDVPENIAAHTAQNSYPKDIDKNAQGRMVERLHVESAERTLAMHEAILALDADHG
jgi:hypothetical protein